MACARELYRRSRRAVHLEAVRPSLHLFPRRPPTNTYCRMEPNKPVSPLTYLKATIYPVSHGRHHNNTSYESSAFFIENEVTGRSFLIFGDVEPDSVSGESWNRKIWEETARRIRGGVLNTIFLECSYSVSLALFYMRLTERLTYSLVDAYSRVGKERSYMVIYHRRTYWKSSKFWLNAWLAKRVRQMQIWRVA